MGSPGNKARRLERVLAVLGEFDSSDHGEFPHISGLADRFRGCAELSAKGAREGLMRSVARIKREAENVGRVPAANDSAASVKRRARTYCMTEKPVACPKACAR